MFRDIGFFWVDMFVDVNVNLYSLLFVDEKMQKFEKKYG